MTPDRPSYIAALHRMMYTFVTRKLMHLAELVRRVIMWRQMEFWILTNLRMRIAQ